jgi:hypothetical protein
MAQLTHESTYIWNLNRTSMLDYLLGFDLALLTIAQAVLVYHCFQARNHLPKWAERSHQKAEEWTEMIGEVGAILTDIADTLDDSRQKAVSEVMSVPGESITGLLTNALLSRMMMPPDDGSKTNTLGQIYEGEDPPTLTQEDNQPHASG